MTNSSLATNQHFARALSISVTVFIGLLAVSGEPAWGSIFDEDFESYAPSSNLIGQGGWEASPKFGVNPVVFGDETLVGSATGLATSVSNGRLDPGNGKLVIADNVFAPTGLAQLEHRLEFDAYAHSSGPPSVNSGVFFRDDTGQQAAGWFTNDEGSGALWTFDVRNITGNASNLQSFAVGLGIDTAVNLTVILDPVGNEVYGIADFGTGTLFESIHYAITTTQFATIDGISILHDYRDATDRLGAEFDNINVAAVPEANTLIVWTMLTGIVAAVSWKRSREAKLSQV